LRSGWLLAAVLLLFTATDVLASCLTLSWIAPGDDGDIGQAGQYEVRYATFPFNEETWSDATIARNPPRPAPAGTREYFIVSGLKSETLYYFAAKTCDEAHNWSKISNVISRWSPADECFHTVGNANCDPDDLATISDIAAIVGYLFLGEPLCCPLEANVNGDPEGAITISDIAVLVDHLFLTQVPLKYCP